MDRGSIATARLATLLLLASLLLSGCWDLREPEDMTHALVLGFDIDERGFYEVTAQFADPAAGGAGRGTMGEGIAGGGAGPPAYWTNSAVGRTPFEALRGLSLTTSRLVRMDHVEVLLLSERLARHGIGPVLDLVERDRELRLTVRAAVVEGDLRGLLSSTWPLETSPAMGLARSLTVLRVEWSVVPDRPLLADITILTRPGEEMLITRVKVPDTGAARSTPSKTPAQSPPCVVDGAAAFQGEKMVGWFTGRETRGRNRITGPTQRGPILLKSPADRSLITVDLAEAQSSAVAVVDGGEVRMKVSVWVHGHIQDVTNPTGGAPRVDLRDPQVIRSLRNRMAAVIRNDIELSLARARQLGTDVFGFGNAVYRKHPEVWERIGSQWDSVFKTLPVEITVQTVLHHSGLVLSSAPR